MCQPNPREVQQLFAQQRDPRPFLPSFDMFSCKRLQISKCPDPIKTIIKTISYSWHMCCLPARNTWQFRTRCSPEITRFFIRPPRTPCSSGSSSCGFGGINIDRFSALWGRPILDWCLVVSPETPGLTCSDFFFSLDVMTRVTGKSPIEFDDFPSEVSLHGGFPITMFDFQRVSLLFMCGVDR